MVVEAAATTFGGLRVMGHQGHKACLLGSVGAALLLVAAPDSVGGQTLGPDVQDSDRFAGVFATSQLGDWSIAAGAVGLDLDQVGPGTATISDAVVRHASTAFSGCLVCSVAVHRTDFVDVQVGVLQSFYQVPVAPCTPVMGRDILDGGNAVWNRADAQENYWGGSGGPSTDVNWAEIALAFADQKSQYDKLVKDLPPDDYDVVTSAFDNMAAQAGDRVPNFDLSGYAGVTVSVQTCLIPVINITFPLLVVPVDFSNSVDSPIHDDAALAGL